MSGIQKKHIWLATACLVAGVYLLFAGFLKHWLFFVLAAAAFASYVFVDRKYLGCPKCRAFINIDRLFYAFWNDSYCHRCGEKLTIK